MAGARRGPPSPSPATGPPRPASPGFPAFGQRSPSGGWLGGPGARPDRHQRARDRRSCRLGPVTLPALGPGGDATLSIAVPTARPGPRHAVRRRPVVRGPLRPRGPAHHGGPPAHVIVYPDPAECRRRGRPGGPPPGPRALADGGHHQRAVGGRAQRVAALRARRPADAPALAVAGALGGAGGAGVRRAPGRVGVAARRPATVGAHSGDSIEKTIARAAGFGIGRPGTGPDGRAVHEHGRPHGGHARHGSGRQTMLRALALLGPASAPPAVVRRWGDRPVGGAVWATGECRGRRRRPRHHALGRGGGHVPRRAPGRADTVLVP